MSKRFKNIKHRAVRLGIVLLVGFWVFSLHPSSAFAAACTAMTVGTGTDVGATTVAPGSGIATMGVFTTQATNGTTCANKSITAMVITLAGSGTPYLGLAEVRVTDSTDATLYFNATSTFYSGSPNAVNLSGGTALPVTLSAVTFHIRVTPLSQSAMPAPNGASYTLNPLVSAVTTTLTPTVSDTNPNNTVIDNLSPAAATSLSLSAGTAKATLGWTSTNGETSTSTILRWASSSAGSEVPAEGTKYTAGDTIGTATVACNFAALTTATVKSSIVDGSGGTAGCTTSALSNGQAYTYKVFQQDVNGNYDTGTSFGSITTDSVAPTVSTQSASASANTATLNGTIVTTGGTNPTIRGFAWGTDPTLATVISTTTESGSFSTGAFTALISNLACNTAYYSRAYATNSIGTAFGAISGPSTTSACGAATRTMRLFQGFRIKVVSGRLKLQQSQ